MNVVVENYCSGVEYIVIKLKIPRSLKNQFLGVFVGLRAFMQREFQIYPPFFGVK